MKIPTSEVNKLISLLRNSKSIQNLTNKLESSLSKAINLNKVDLFGKFFSQKERFNRDKTSYDKIVKYLTNNNLDFNIATKFKDKYPVVQSYMTERTTFRPNLGNEVLDMFKNKGRTIETTIPKRSKVSQEYNDFTKQINELRGGLKDYFQSKAYRKKLRDILFNNSNDRKQEGKYINDILNTLDGVAINIGHSNKNLGGTASFGTVYLNKNSTFDGNPFTLLHELIHASKQYGNYNIKGKYLDAHNSDIANRVMDYNDMIGDNLFSSVNLSAATPAQQKYIKYLTNGRELSANFNPIQALIEKNGWSPKQAVRLIKERNYLGNTTIKNYYNVFGEKNVERLIQNVLKNGGKLIKRK